MGFASGTRRRIKRFGKVCYVPKLTNENRKEIIDYVFKKLEKQGKPSVDDRDRCMYRGRKDGDQLCCGVGFVIDDNEVVEATGVRLLSCMESTPSEVVSLLYNIQHCHDYASSDSKQDRSKFIEILKRRKEATIKE